MPTTVSGSYPAVNSDSDATINGLTVGRGAGAVATNVALGQSALAGNSTGLRVTAVGNQALLNNTASENTALGARAMLTNTSGANNTAVGRDSMYFNTTGGENSALGLNSLISNTTGSNNTAIGRDALQANTTASNNTAVGYQAGYSNTTAAQQTAIGFQSFYTSNRTADTNGYNTGLGHQTGYSTTTGNFNTFIGQSAGYFVTTGSINTFLGTAAGSQVTTGSKNTILGPFSGNNGGLDIRTASNNIVLSDGDGNPYLYFGSTGQSTFRTVGVDNLITMTSSAAAYSSRIQMGSAGGGAAVLASTQNQLSCQTGGTGGVFLSSGGTSWQASSDERVKENLQEITNATSKVASLRAVTGNYIWDESKKSRAFLIAQDVLEVLPEAVETKNPDEYGLAYSDVIPLLVAAIKELKAEVDSLKAQLNNGA